MDFMSTDFDLAENVFYFHNADIQSLAFVLDWDTKDKFYSTLLSKSYADILDVPNDHSMVLAKPGKTNYFHLKIPAFDIKYIEDCFKIKDFPDPTKYLIKNTSPASYTKNDIFDCWLYQNKSWSDLVSISENKNDNHKIISSSTNLISKAKRSNDDFDDIMMSNDQKIKKNTRMPYSHKEEISIVKYIIKNNYAFNVTGVTMWQKMERDRVCKYRTWQSMKQRYVKHIKFDLNSGNHRFPFLSPEELKLLRLGLNIEKIDKEKKDAMKSRFLEQRMHDSDSDSS
ncbi:hypothetical protein AGLY_013361 [Aphis glycines]|uniref:Telomeric repeat-binding factor 2-interacting protein 1 n=1 Tax=Aphis glycines TaxID=307491 RepID=A0A6G0T6Y3_APHGL|nr:hypothetical protein AGLY_013361 [Aphis glycines]